MIGIVAYLLCFIVFLVGIRLIPMPKKARRVGTVLLCVSLLLELVVFNFHSFQIMFGGYEKQELDLKAENVSVTGGQNNTFTSDSKGGKIVITVTDMDQRVGSVCIFCDFPKDAPTKKGTPAIDFKINATDETSQGGRNSVASGQIIRDDARSGCIVLDMSGKVSSLQISLNAASGQTFTLRGVTLNQVVPMRFSAFRLFLFMLIAFGGYLLCTLPVWRAAYEEKRSFFRIAALAMTIVMMFGALVVTFLNMYDSKGGISTGYTNTSGNQITQELVDAFEAGQVSLLEEPGQDLLDLENPYDWSARQKAGVKYKWDHLLYDGKYYSYYGIAPVILLFLPYHMVTGYYFPTAEAIWLFGALGIMFLTLLFFEIIDRFGRKIPNNILFCTLFIMQISSGVWYNFMRDNFYEIAQSCGFMFTCGGFFFLIRSGVVGEGRIRYRHLALSSVFLSFAVLSRPTLAVYCVVSLIYLGYGLHKHILVRKTVIAEDVSAGKKKRSLFPPVLWYLVASLLPFVLIGGLQMLYNYVRFGSVLDFGIQYSLTINDFTRSEYHTDFAMIGFYNFLFAFPLIKPEFPYVFSNFSTLHTNGYYYVANRNAIGLLFRALPVFGYLGAGSALRRLEKKDRVKAILLIGPLCILMPLVIIFSIWESGYGVRYCTDFAWQIILGGALVLWFLYQKVAGEQVKRIMEKFFVIAAAVALTVNGAMLYDYMQKTGYLASRYLSFARLFDFWV